MRKITDHKINGLNEHLDITVQDEPGHGGASHRYDITGFNSYSNPSATLPDGYKSSFGRAIILFQNGPLKEAEPNGVSIEAILAVAADRLRGFQSGQFKNEHNALALMHIENAVRILHERTKERVARGVEGTLQK